MARKRVVDPSHKIFTEASCSATGEQRQYFGYAAHRYLTTKKSHDEINGQSSGVRETHLDTWVLDLPVSPHLEGIASPNANYVIGLGVSGGIMKIPDVKATHSGPLPHGLVVSLKSEDYESEVVALSLTPLDESVFEAPKNFREVNPAGSWSHEFALGWLRFRAWLDSLFGI